MLLKAREYTLYNVWDQPALLELLGYFILGIMDLI